MENIPWFDPKITPEIWLFLTETTILKRADYDMLPDYQDIAGMLGCTCPSPIQHLESRQSSSSLLPCWFEDPKMKHKFGIMYLLKTVPLERNSWIHLLGNEFHWEKLLSNPKCSEVQPLCLNQMSDAILEGLDVTQESVQIFLAMLDLANLLRLWDWKLSRTDLMAIVTSEWVLSGQKELLVSSKNTPKFPHTIFGLLLTIKRIREFIQSLALDLITISIEEPASMLSHLPHLIGQALGPLWNLIHPWEGFIHAQNFLHNCECLFEHLMNFRSQNEVPSIQPTYFKIGHGFCVSQNISMEKVAQSCTVCSKEGFIPVSLFASSSRAHLLYPRKILVSKPGEPLDFAVACSHQCHEAFGDYFKLLTWTDKMTKKATTSSKIQTNASIFLHIPKGQNNRFPAIAHKPFLANAKLDVFEASRSLLFNQSYQDLITESSTNCLSLIIRLLQNELGSINKFFHNEYRRRDVFDEELSYLEDDLYLLEDMGSIRCFWQHSWHPVSSFDFRNRNDYLVVSHLDQKHPSYTKEHEKGRKVLELLVLEREFVVFCISNNCFKAQDTKIGVHFRLRRPHYRNNFSPDSLQSGRSYVFARRLDLKTRNCVGGFFVPSSSHEDEWIGVLVPDMFDRLIYQPRLDVTIQQLNSFQSTFEINKVSRGSVPISRDSIGRGYANEMKKTTFFVMTMMLHRVACESDPTLRRDIKVKMIPFNMILPNIPKGHCTITLNFAFMFGETFLPLIQHISRKLNIRHEVDFTIVDKKEGILTATDSIPDQWFQGSFDEKYAIVLINRPPNRDFYMGKFGTMLTWETRLVFDGELLVFQVQFISDVWHVPHFQGIASQDQTLASILIHVPNCSSDIVWDLRQGKSFLYYVNGRDVATNVGHLFDSTLKEVAEVVGHVRPHFCFFLLEREDPHYIQSIFPFVPLPLFARYNHNDLMFNDNAEILMWRGEVIVKRNYEINRFQAWITHQSGDFKKPKHWETFFKTLLSRSWGRLLSFEENLAQHLKENSTIFSIVFSPDLTEITSPTYRSNLTIDQSFQSLIALFLSTPSRQKALLIPIGCQELRVGIVLKEDYDVGFRFCVLHDPSSIQKYFPQLPSLKTPSAFPLERPPIFTYKAQKMCYVLAIFNVTQHVDKKCALPVFMVARALSPNIALGDLAPKERVEGVVGSHVMLPITTKTAKFSPTPNVGIIEFLLGSKIQTIRAKYPKCIELILDLCTDDSYDISTFIAFWLFRGTLVELKQLALKNNVAEVARRSVFLKPGPNKNFATGFLFPQGLQEEVTKELMPLFLANHQPCECFRCTNKLDMHANAEEREMELLWHQNDEREEAQRSSKESNNGAHRPAMKSKFPGLFELFKEERTAALVSNAASDNHSYALKQSNHFIQKETNDKMDFTISPKGNIEKKIKTAIVPSINLLSLFDRFENEAKPVETSSKNESKIHPSEMNTLDVWIPLETFVQRPTSEETRNNVLEEMIRHTWNKSVEKEEPLRACDNCGREDFELQVCNVCKASFFCNEKCFKKARKAHKKMCSLIVGQRFKLLTEPQRIHRHTNVEP